MATMTRMEVMAHKLEFFGFGPTEAMDAARRIHKRFPGDVFTRVTDVWAEAHALVIDAERPVSKAKAENTIAPLEMLRMALLAESDARAALAKAQLIYTGCQYRREVIENEINKRTGG